MNLNQAPSIESVSISPDPAYGGDSPACSYAGFADADGDPDQEQHRLDSQ